MPEGKPSGDNSQTLKPDAGAVIPRMRLGEQGVLGLKISNRQIYEESQRAFRYPYFIKTVDEMRRNPTMGSAMNVYRMMISRVPWDVIPPANATETEIARAVAVRSMMDDMQDSWSCFIESVIPYLEYGFGIHEKVFRRRLKKNGSKWNDGLVGLKKLAPRSQDTICGWVFDQSGSDLVAVEQTLAYTENPQFHQDKVDPNTGNIRIPREKFLLFTASATKSNPEGNSMFKNVYLAWKQLSMLQDQELVGIAKDVQGMLKIGLPPRYLDVNASPEDKAVAQAYQRMIDNYNEGKQRGFLVPHMIDPETKQPLFIHELMDAKGVSKYDIEAIIKRLQNDILTALSVDVLKLGSEGSGSFSLADAKTSVLSLAIDYRLREIKEVLNTDLMRSIYELNGWSCENMAQFTYSDVEEIDIETFSKAVQRIFSTSAIEVDRPVLNRIREAIGVAPKGDNEEVDVDNMPAVLTGNATAAGKGMAIGTTGDGTAKTATGKDRSSSNANNTA